MEFEMLWFLRFLQEVYTVYIEIILMILIHLLSNQVYNVQDKLNDNFL